jgi:hypothetical protein
LRLEVETSTDALTPEEALFIVGLIQGDVSPVAKAVRAKMLGILTRRP